MSEHTPGPWLVATSCSFRRIVSERGEPVCIPTVQRSDGHPDMEFPNGGPEGPDACLIAAAPKLYAELDGPSLNSLLGMIEDSGDAEMWAAAKGFMERRDELLRKARGEK